MRDHPEHEYMVGWAGGRESQWSGSACGLKSPSDVVAKGGAGSRSGGCRRTPVVVVVAAV